MNKITLICFIFVFSMLHAAIERRAAIDIGSGATKVSIADVDTETSQVVELILEISYPVPYQASLEKSEDGTFDSVAKEQGLRVLSEIKEIAADCQVQKIVAVATSAFRKANNSKEFIAEIEKETKISIEIIPQREEGEVAFFSALSTNEAPLEKSVVIDIGTGSVQITAHSEKSGLIVYMGEQMGSLAFKNYIISVLQKNNLDHIASPNPISEKVLKMADSYARAFARKAYPVIKEKIQNGAKIMGIGRLFYHSIRPLASEDGVITRRKLRTFIESSLNKSDKELKNPFAHVDVSNCILTLAIMKALHIQEIHPIETTSTRGLLISPNYWR